MRIVFGIQSLGGHGGTESYVATVGDHLQRLGHDVWVHSSEDGPLATAAEALGLRLSRSVTELPDQIDVLLPQDAPSSIELARARPAVPQVYVAHSDLFDVQLPSPAVASLRCVVALYDRAERRLKGMALNVPIERLPQPIDTERFKPRAPLGDRPRVALALGNYLAGERARIVSAGCERAGVEFRHVGEHGEGLTISPEDHYNAADIVFGKAKVIHEAMACGRAAYVLDHNGTEGWVTHENFADLSADNFGGQHRPKPLTVESLASDLAGYTPSMGVVNRDLMVAYHDAVKHASGLVELIGRHAGGPVRSPGEDPAMYELSRLTRIAWRHESQAFRLNYQLAASAAVRGELEHQIALQKGDIAALRDELEVAEAAIERIVESLPWRTMRAVRGGLKRLAGRK
jgi:hypothetical protein